MATKQAPLLGIDISATQSASGTHEYSSGFSKQSFLSDDFNVTRFINSCTARITEMINEDFNKTLHLIDDVDNKDELKAPSNNNDVPDEQEEEEEEELDLSSFPSKHLTAQNLQQLHNDLSACYEHLKQELISSFQQNYPQFLELNHSLTAGTESNLKRCQDLLNNIHKKYLAVYQQILRLLERIHSKSTLKANHVSKVNTLKQLSSVPAMIENIQSSLKTLHEDFDPFEAFDSDAAGDRLDKLDAFKQAFCKQICNATERRQYRLLQKSSRLERIAILLTKLAAIYQQTELTQHLIIKNKQNEYMILKNRFYAELKKVFLESINCGSLLSLRSNLRCYNYLYDEKSSNLTPEAIVREKYIKPKICIPLTLFLNRSNLNEQSKKERRQKINASFDKLYTVLTEQLSILFNKEIMVNNDFIADGVWYELVDNLFNEDFNEAFISRGLPDLFHQHYCAVMRFFRRLQQLYYTQMTCNMHKDHDQYLYFHAASIRLRNKCNLQQYYLFRMPYITQSMKEIISNKYSSIKYHYQIYLAYYNKMKQREDDTKQQDEQNEAECNLYMKRVNEVKGCLMNSTQESKHSKSSKLQFRHFEYNYLLPVFQVCIINALKCWDSETIWIWQLSSNFLKLTIQILSFLHQYLRQQINDNACSSLLLVVVDSDLYYFNNWVKFELLPLIEYEFTNSIADRAASENMKQLIEQSMHPSMQKLQDLRESLLGTSLVDTILNECKVSLSEVDEIADPMQVNIRFNDSEDSIVQQKVSDYVSKLFQPLKQFLMFINEHSLEHISMNEKNKLIWNVLDALCADYWSKLKNVQERLTSIRKLMEKRSKRRKRDNTQKSSAEKAEYQLFLDVRQFMQQMQGFVNGLQRDEKSYLDRQAEQEEQQQKKSKSSAIQIKKRSKPRVTQYATNNLQCWNNFERLIQQFQ